MHTESLINNIRNDSQSAIRDYCTKPIPVASMTQNAGLFELFGEGYS